MSKLVPDGWESKPLSALADYRNGRAFKPSDWSKSGLPILRIAQINSPGDIEDYFDGDDVEDKHLIRKGDLIFSWSATLKAIIWKDYNAVLNQHIFKVEERSDTSRTYLQQLLEHSIPKLLGSSHGSTMKHIRKGVLDEFQCVVPPVSEQNKIASILISVDEMIDTIQKKIDKLQDLKKATMNELLSKGIGHTEFKDSELGKIPKRWTSVKLKDISKFRRGTTYMVSELSKDGKRYPLYVNMKSFKVGGGYNTDGDKFYTSSYGNKQIIGKNDLLIANTDITASCDILGAPLYLAESKFQNDILFSHHVTALSLDSKIDNKFLFFSLCSSVNRIKMQSYGRGTTVKMLDSKEFGKLPLNIPPLPEQRKIASTLTSIEGNIESRQRKLAQTQCLKKSLTQDLLTGKVRVKM